MEGNALLGDKHGDFPKGNRRDRQVTLAQGFIGELSAVTAQGRFRQLTRRHYLTVPLTVGGCQIDEGVGYGVRVG